MDSNNVSLVLSESKCSNNCVFCNGKEMGNIEKNVKFELNKLKQLSSKRPIDGVEISGNDPIEYPKLPEFVREIKKIANPEKIVVSTHGRDLKDLVLFKELIKSGMTGLRVPIYGATGEVHDNITKANGSFDDLLLFFDNAFKLKFKVGITSLILRENQDSLKSLVYAFSKMPFAENLRMGLAAFEEAHTKFKDSVPNFDELRKTLPIALKFALSLNLRLEIADIPYCLIGFDYPHVISSPIAPHAYEFRQSEKEPMELIDNKVAPKYLQKTKGDVCKSCIYDSRCDGIFKAYVDQELFEFKPITRVR